MVEPEEAQRLAVQIVNSSIDELVSHYLENPYHFYTENDLHCHLFSSIFEKLWATGLNQPWITKDGKSSILLQKEYPTKARYRRNRAPQEPEKTNTGARGHFDLCLWDPLQVDKKFFRSNGGEGEQETFIAIELDLVENQVPAQEALHHVKWDLLKLSDPDNHVKHGYMLFFTRNWMNRNEFIQLTKEQLNHTEETVALYIESSPQGNRHTTFQNL